MALDPDWAVNHLRVMLRRRLAEKTRDAITEVLRELEERRRTVPTGGPPRGRKEGRS